MRINFLFAVPILVGVAACSNEQTVVANGTPNSCTDPIVQDQIIDQAADILIRNTGDNSIRGLLLLGALSGDAAPTADAIRQTMKDRYELNDISGSMDGDVAKCRATLLAVGQQAKAPTGETIENLKVEIRGVSYTVSPDSEGTATVFVKRTSILSEPFIDGQTRSNWMAAHAASPQLVEEDGGIMPDGDAEAAGAAMNAEEFEEQQETRKAAREAAARESEADEAARAAEEAATQYQASQDSEQ